MTYRIPKTRADFSASTWNSMVRNCRSYCERHDDTYDQQTYVQNLAGLHNVDFMQLWGDATAAPTIYSSWMRPWSR